MAGVHIRKGKSYSFLAFRAKEKYHKKKKDAYKVITE